MHRLPDNPHRFRRLQGPASLATTDHRRDGGQRQSNSDRVPHSDIRFFRAEFDLRDTTTAVLRRHAFYFLRGNGCGVRHRRWGSGLFSFGRVVRFMLLLNGDRRRQGM